MSKTSSLAIGVAALLVAPLNLSALTLATRGMGQVLEFPYYTVNANQNTVLTIINTVPHGKALKVRFREAYDGRVAAQFNVYLSPFDVWTAAVFENNGTVAVGSRDNTCTVPAFDSKATGAGLPALPFSTASFTGTNADSGPTDASRLNEGNFEVFEMGEIVDGSPISVQTTHVNAVSPCGLNPSWSADIFTNPNANLTAPTGGLYGSAAIVNVGTGTYFAIAPTIIGGFSTAPQHTDPSSAAPDFDTASADADGHFAASLDIDGKVLDLHYTRAVDAVSALFMTAHAYNEYVTDEGEQTDWVSTFPTKRFYTDPEINTSVDTKPFDVRFGDATDTPGSCLLFALTLFDREENTTQPSGCTSSPCAPGFVIQSFCQETSVLAIAQFGDYPGSALKTNLQQAFTPAPIGVAGHFDFDFIQNYPNHQLPASIEGTVLFGVPQIGFVAENYINANVTPGVLANYSGTIPHRSTVTCATGTAACP